MIPSVQTTGAAGTRNPRSSSGLRTRMIQIPAQTRMKANNVPILVVSPVTSAGTNAARTPVNLNNTTTYVEGLRYRGSTPEKMCRTNPSRLTEENMRELANLIIHMAAERTVTIN